MAVKKYWLVKKVYLEAIVFRFRVVASSKQPLTRGGRETTEARVDHTENIYCCTIWGSSESSISFGQKLKGYYSKLLRLDQSKTIEKGRQGMLD